MAAQTGNTCISGTAIDSVKITTVMLGFSTVTSSKKVSSNDCSNDRQPEMAAQTEKNTDDTQLYVALKDNKTLSALTYCIHAVRHG